MDRPLKHYDRISIGTSIIHILESVYQAESGKTVLMIERENEIGGAWRSLELFGIGDVENAVHYLLPDKKAFDFMRNILAWDVITVDGKCRVIPVPGFGYVQFSFDNQFGRMFAKLYEAAKTINFKDLRNHRNYWNHRTLYLRGFLGRAIASPMQKSKYVKGGSPEMLRKVKEILDASSVQVSYSTNIKRIDFDTESAVVHVVTDRDKYTSDMIHISHGSRLENLVFLNGMPLRIKEKALRRPVIHILARDPTPKFISECIFTADRVIKYAHDITEFTKQAQELRGRKKLIVLALQPECIVGNDTFLEVFKRLKKVRMLSSEAVLEDRYTWDAILPPLEDQDLEMFKQKCASMVYLLKTENFTAGIGEQCDKWSNKIRGPISSVVEG